MEVFFGCVLLGFLWVMGDVFVHASLESGDRGTLVFSWMCRVGTFWFALYMLMEVM